LPEEAKQFFLDEPGINRIYTRAFSIADAEEEQDIEIARCLMREFPDDPNIPRWVNQATVKDSEFESLLLDMQANHIRRRLKQGGMGLEESLQLRQRLDELTKQQIKIRDAMHQGVQ
jgi:hypothetical protein